MPTRRGPVNNNVVLIDWGLQASLTGAKTFHGFQPFVGGALGLASAPHIGALWSPVRSRWCLCRSSRRSNLVSAF